MFDPRSGLVISVRKKAFEQIERLIYLSHHGVEAGDIILSQNIVRIDCQRSGQPFSGALRLVQLQQTTSSQVRWSGVLRMNSQFTLCPFDASARSLLYILVAP